MADTKTPRSDHTTTTTTTNTGGSGMAFVVGALVVVVAGLAYFVFADGETTGSDDINITVEGAGTAVEDAADAVEGAVASE